jgi:WD40 repeat protein
VTGSDDGKVKVMVAETGEIIYDTADHQDWVRAVLFTSKFFISASDDKQVMFSSSTPRAE